jgi:hypothetical protein
MSKQVEEREKKSCDPTSPLRRGVATKQGCQRSPLCVQGVGVGLT